jgi:uncharacterized protein YbjQ (UPF0145 family)
MKSYHSLMDRARRETTVRLLESAREMGYNAICNLRMEPADIGGNIGKKGSVMVCIVGSATAYHSGIQIQYSTPPVAPTKPAAITPQKPVK